MSDNDEEWSVEIHRGRAQGSLYGLSTLTKDETAKSLIIALRSGEPLGEHLSEAIAGALERGLSGEAEGSRLVVQGSFGYNDAINRYRTRRNWLDALRAYKIHRDRGLQKRDAEAEIRTKFGITGSVEEYLRTCRKFRKRFENWMLTNDQRLRKELSLGPNQCVNFHECMRTHDCIRYCDHRAMAESTFCEEESQLN
ncbi:MAG: hypothetical protein ABJP34_10655 [Erythrobacter sp.]